MALTKEVKELRKTGIGGSDVAGIFGVSKWATPLDIFFSKIQEVEDEEIDNDAIEWGNRLEALVVQAFSQKTGKECITDLETFRHPDYPHLLANVDAMIKGENAALEVKTARFAGEWGERGSDKIPNAYLLQVAHYSAVLNLDKVYIAVLISGSDFRIYEYNKNEKLEKLIIKKNTEFWNNHVVAQVPPQAINSEDALKLWSTVNPLSAKTIDDTILEKIDYLKRIKAHIKDLQKQEEEEKFKVLSFLEDYEALVDHNSNTLATWKQQSYNRFDVNRFKNEHANLYEQYTKQSTTRVFRINN